MILVSDAAASFLSPNFLDVVLSCLRIRLPTPSPSPPHLARLYPLFLSLSLAHTHPSLPRFWEAICEDSPLLEDRNFLLYSRASAAAAATALEQRGSLGCKQSSFCLRFLPHTHAPLPLASLVRLSLCMFFLFFLFDSCLALSPADALAKGNNCRMPSESGIM